MKNYTLSIIVPALNEEKNILLVIHNTLSALKEFAIEGEIIVVNDGSTDSTPVLVEKEIKENPNIVKMITHKKPEGIGASFWDGVDRAGCDIVVLIPGDNENNPREILRYYKLLDDVDIVIPFVFNKEVRSFSRNLISFVYRFIINATFLVNFNYTNGTVLYRKSALKELESRSKGFFYQAESLIRLAKGGCLFAEVPYKLNQRKGGISKAVTWRSVKHFIKDYFCLVWNYYFSKSRNDKIHFTDDSLTSARRK